MALIIKRGNGVPGTWHKQKISNYTFMIEIEILHISSLWITIALDCEYGMQMLILLMDMVKTNQSGKVLSGKNDVSRLIK
jgi:hypothetical protein